MKLYDPIKGEYRISQRFGEGAEWYKAKLGIPYHNGVDITANRGIPIVFPADAIVLTVRDTIDESYRGTEHSAGNYVRFATQSEKEDVILIHRFLHMLQDIPVQVGLNYVAGDILGYIGSTGFSTGYHTHWDILRAERLPEDWKGSYDYLVAGRKYKTLDKNNGTGGLFDFFDLVDWESSPYVLPVAERYGQPASKAREAAWSVFYRGEKARQQAIDKGFSNYEWPLMKNAFVYGFWPKELVFNEVAFPIWSRNTYPAYKKYLENPRKNTLNRGLPFTPFIGGANNNDMNLKPQQDWYVSSTGKGLSTTLQGLLMANVPLLLMLARFYGVDVAETEVVEYITSLTGLVAAAVVAYGSIRKVYNKIAQRRA